MERAVRQELRAADLPGLRLEYVENGAPIVLRSSGHRSCRRARCSSTATTLPSRRAKDCLCLTAMQQDSP
jgi:hypothetical protein